MRKEKYPPGVYEEGLMEDCSNLTSVTERTEEEKKNINNRINRLVGQMNGIKKMVEDDRYCADVLIQLSAIDKSIKSLANYILDNHIHTCVKDQVQEGNTEVLAEIVDLFKRFQ